MTDGKPAPTTTSNRTIRGEIAEWLHDVRLGWTKSLSHGPLSGGQRQFYAFIGSFTFLTSTRLVLPATNPTLYSTIFDEVTYTPHLILLLSLWFGWLVGFVERSSGPVRLFLDGLFLPAAVVTIIAFSLGQIESAPQETVTLEPERQPFTLEPPD